MMQQRKEVLITINSSLIIGKISYCYLMFKLTLRLRPKPSVDKIIMSLIKHIKLYNATHESITQ